MKTMITAMMMAPLSVWAHPGHAEVSGEGSQFFVLAIVVMTTISIPWLAMSLRRVLQRIKKD